MYVCKWYEIIQRERFEKISPTLFILSDRTFSKTPNGRATDVGIPIQEGTFPLRYDILRDLAPTWMYKNNNLLVRETLLNQKKKRIYKENFFRMLKVV